jgi:hypothetical protein
MPSKEIQKNKSPRVELEAQGRLLTVKAIGLDREFRLGGARGDVTVFSSGSRMRLLRKLARVSPPATNGFRHRCTFLTLTTRAIHHPRRFKEFMRAFFKRLVRKAPRLAAIWRLEYQKRGAPHLHIILYNMPFVDKLWIQESWGEIVGQARPFTRIESIRSYKHLMSYASKYAAKVASCGFNSVTYQAEGENVTEYGHLSPGRVWGVFNKGCLPFEDKTQAVVPLDGSWWMLRRYCCKFYPWVWENDDGGFTVFTDEPYHALRHMVSMSAYFCNAEALV